MPRFPHSSLVPSELVSQEELTELNTKNLHEKYEATMQAMQDINDDWLSMQADLLEVLEEMR
jgi:hypothetical protein